jgi:hypothetical protein
MAMRCWFQVLVMALSAIVPLRVQAVIMHSPGEGAAAPDYIAYGTESKFQATGWFTSLDPSGATALSSGTLIDPHWVLTAAHTVDNRTPLKVGFGTNLFSDPGVKHDVTQAFIHPGWLGGVPSAINSTPNPDLALLYFADPILDITPAPLFTGTLSSNSTNPDRVHQIGYGLPAYQGAASPYDGQKRGAINRAFDTHSGNAGEYLRTYLFDTARPAHYEHLGGAASPGDSGGSIYVDVAGQMQLAGVISFGVAGRYESTGSLQTSLYNDWITDTMASVPEPMAGIFVVGALAFLRRARRAA